MFCLARFNTSGTVQTAVGRRRIISAMLFFISSQMYMRIPDISEYRKFDMPA